MDPHSTAPPGEKHILFALLSMNGPLPAELKFRENTETVNNGFIKHLLVVSSIFSFM